MSFLDELERDLLQAAERRRDARPSQRLSRLRRIVLATLLFALIGATTAGAGLLLLRGTVIPGPAVRDVPRDQLPLPGTTRLTGLTAEDPVAGRPPWTLRLARSSTGLLCSTVGQLDGGRFGLVGLDGRFRTYPERIVDSCGERLDGERVSLLGARVFDADDPREVRTVVNGVAGPALRAVTLEVRGRRREAPVGPGGTFLAVLPGYPEDSGVQATLRFASGKTETHPFGIASDVVVDPDGGGAWRATTRPAWRLPGVSCAAFEPVRPRAGRGLSPGACGRDGAPAVVAVERIEPGIGSWRAQFTGGGNWGRHPARTAVWGWLGREAAAIEISGAGEPRRIAVRRHAAFAVVFSPAVDPADLRVSIHFANGRVVTTHGDLNRLPAKELR